MPTETDKRNPFNSQLQSGRLDLETQPIGYDFCALGIDIAQKHTEFLSSKSSGEVFRPRTDDLMRSPRKAIMRSPSA